MASRAQVIELGAVWIRRARRGAFDWFSSDDDLER